jgi:hypothetical protein
VVVAADRLRHGKITLIGEIVGLVNIGRLFNEFNEEERKDGEEEVEKSKTVMRGEGHISLGRTYPLI